MDAITSLEMHPSYASANFKFLTSNKSEREQQTNELNGPEWTALSVLFVAVDSADTDRGDDNKASISQSHSRLKLRHKKSEKFLWFFR